MVVFKQDTTSVSAICDWTNQTLRQFRPSVSRACEACNREAYSQAAFVTVPGQGHLLLSVWLRLPIYLVTGICSCNASLSPSTLALVRGSEAVWRTVYGLRLRGSRAERVLHSPGSAATGLVWVPFVHVARCVSAKYPSAKQLLIFPMERISGSLALAISEHRLGDALYALLLSRHAKEP